MLLLLIDLAKKGEFKKVGEVFGGKEFADFEQIATVLVRSEALSQEDKVALGTIKRYGIVADAIIMLGGAKAELRSGGVPIAGEGSGGSVAEDEDEEEADGDNKVAVNEKELLRYLKLSKDSLADIYKIIEPVMNK